MDSCCRDTIATSLTHLRPLPWGEAIAVGAIKIEALFLKSVEILKDVEVCLLFRQNIVKSGRPCENNTLKMIHQSRIFITSGSKCCMKAKKTLPYL